MTTPLHLPNGLMRDLTILSNIEIPVLLHSTNHAIENSTSE